MADIVKKISLYFFLFLLLLLFIFTLWGLGRTAGDASLDRGILPGEAWSPEEGRVLRLSGQWLADTGGVESSRAGESGSYLDLGLSSLWNRIGGGGLTPVYGEAVYSCTLRTSGTGDMMALRMPRIYSAYTVQINGEEIFRSGVPGASMETEIPGGDPVIVPFRQTGDEITIEIRVSNRHGYAGGFYRGVPEYGRLQDVILRDGLLRGTGLLVLFLFLFHVLFRYIQYFQHPREHFHFYLGLGLALFVLRLLAGDCFQFRGIQGLLGHDLRLRLQVILIWLMVPFFINYARHFLGTAGGKKRFAPVSIAVTTGLCLIPALLPMERFLPLIPLGSAALAAGEVYILVLSFRAARKKRNLSRLFLAANLFLLLGAMYDTLFLLGVVPGGEFLWLVMLVFATGTIITNIIREERAITRTGSITRSLEEAVVGRNRMLVNISREVGGSLDKVNELTRALIQGSLGPLNSEQLLTSSLVLSSTMHHQHLINDTIDFLRMQDTDLKIEKRGINLSSLILLHLNSFQPVIMGLPVQLQNQVSRELPFVYADESRLGQILYSLVFFGIQHIREGRIRISADPQGSLVTILVELDGVEFNERVEELLDILASGMNAREIQDRELTILRFFLTRNLIRRHGSELEILREDPAGLSFRFTLPVYTGEGDEAVSEEMAIHLDALEHLQPLLEEVPSERNITLLVGVGDSANLQVIKSQLASMNYRVVPVLKGMSVLEKVAEECPDMVIMDSSLSDMTCYAVCRELREQYSANELPIILIIEERQSSDVMESLTAGANDYLRRPYQQEEFLTRVNTHLQVSRINSIYSQFVPKEFLKCLGQENITDLKLGDQVQREMTVLFVDIRAFTNLSENMTPQENFKFINSYLSQFTPIITRNNGFVDKFIGDAIMALYPDRPEDAITTAIEMTEYVKVYNGYRAKCGYSPINIGIGIHTGNLILGIIGDSQRMQGTVISDAVNLASRIQDVTKLYQANVVISQETFVKLDNPTNFNFRFLGKVKVKGKDKSVSLFEIFNSDTEESRRLKEDTKGEFEMAILLFAKRDFTAAEELFRKVLEKNPGDKTAILFLDRARKFLASEKRNFLTSL